ncbi:cyclic nucleotide-binding domain-containing protein [Pseudanabaenaceae cyanobacterium LEGE 13415]|nr:cyclic nucleotide-binding domain-containing protein [Pseudanabaenaceae cyanobacterium LEGE 13415]
MEHRVNIHRATQVSRALKLVPVPLMTLMGSTHTNGLLKPSGTILEQIEVQQFELGDEIFKVETGTNTIEQSELYIVCRGAVRLLCTEPDRNRKLTVDLLEIGASFGLDQWFYSERLAYEAIAATPCQVARIPEQTLCALFQQFPQLKNQIAQQVEQRERLIFFRSLAHFYSVSSRQLKYLFLPQLIEQKISAGTGLNQFTAEHLGQFWLRSGEIVSEKEIAPMPGESWGYFGRSPTDWIAATDLVLYYMPLEQLEATNLLGFL